MGDYFGFSGSVPVDYNHCDICSCVVLQVLKSDLA